MLPVALSQLSIKTNSHHAGWGEGKSVEVGISILHKCK